MNEKKYLFKEESIVNIANEIRRISGDSKKLSIEEIYNFLKIWTKNIQGIKFKLKQATVIKPYYISYVFKQVFGTEKLPPIPQGIEMDYPYIFIYKGNTRYDLIFSKYPYYFSEATDDYPDRLTKDGTGVQNYWLTFEDYAKNKVWSFRNDTNYYFESPENVIYSNYNILKYSSDSNEIYFMKSEKPYWEEII